MKSRIESSVLALALLAVAAPAVAQYVDPRVKMANEEAEEEEARKSSAEAERRRRAMLKKPPVPAVRNGLLGSWHLADGQRPNVGGLGGKSGPNWATDIVGGIASMNLDKLRCAILGGGVTFGPSSYSRQGIDGHRQGSITYHSVRSGAAPVIAAIPGDGGMMVFQVTGPDGIVSDGGCVLVRVGAPGPAAAANGTNAPGNARTGAGSSMSHEAGTPSQVAAAASAPPRSTLARPSPEVCRNTLLDKLGAVGVNQVRAMSDVRFNEPAIEGKVPNTNNLRIDLRGSACDDPRVKATLYDFDGNGMLQSITYVWDRPNGPAPAPIFQERIAQLSRFHALPPPQSPGRLQADTAAGRLILQDMPERNLLLEAYAARK